MKKVLLIGGTMGIGKTTVCQYLKQHLDKSVFLDGDWCWDMHPFVVNEETKNMVMNNITFQINQFLQCTSIEYILLSWVMHEQTIIDEITKRLDECTVIPISLVCDSYTLSKRIEKDVQKGIRQPDVLKRSLERLDMYKKLNTYLIDVSHLSIEETAKEIMKQLDNV